MKPTGKSIYKESTQKELHRKAVIMERTLLLISPISVLVLLNGVFLFRAFIDWAFLKKDFLTSPNFQLLGYSWYVILALIVLVFIYHISATVKEKHYANS